MDDRKYKKISKSCRILDKKRIYSESGVARVSRGGVDCASEDVLPGDVVLMKLEWQGDSYPGCFFQLQPESEYLRRPISLCGSGDGYIELAIRVSGEGTRELTSREIGDAVECFGPLGRGFELPRRENPRCENPRCESSNHISSERIGFEGTAGFAGNGEESCGCGSSVFASRGVESGVTAGDRASSGAEFKGSLSSDRPTCSGEPDFSASYLIIGGGIGVAPLLPLLSALRTSDDITTDFVVGFRGRPYFEDDATHICTEDKEFCLDACLGVNRCIQTHYGTVFPVVEELLRKHPFGTDAAYDDIFICGPKKMLDALALLCMEHGYNPQLLTEAHMGCGVGACLVCTTEVRSEQKYARVCADGPMFRASELRWNHDDSSDTVPLNCASSDCASLCDSSSCDGPSSDGFSSAASSGAGDSCGGAACKGAACKGADSAGKGDMLSVSLGRLHLKSLLTMASGTFGFGREYDEFFDIGILGAVSVKGLTLRQKPGNPGRRVVEIASGMINSVGLQNPGVEHFVAHEAEFLRSKNVAVIANINGESVSDMVEMARLVDPHVDAIELNISCPNVSAGGMSFGTNPRMTAEIVSAVRRVSESPLIVKLTPNVTDIVEIAKVCESEGAEILSMINTVTGLAVDWNTGVKPLARGFGGMSGAAVKPIALRCIHAVSSSVRIPILGMGGISSARDVIEFLRAGASAVAIGTAIFRDPLLPLKIDTELREIMRKQDKTSIGEFSSRNW